MRGIADWTTTLTEKSRELEKRATERLKTLTNDQINWRPDKATWSIGQQFDHLLLSTRPYIEIIQRVGASAGPAQKDYKPSLWGKFMFRAVGPEESFPAPVPKPMVPTEKPVDRAIIDEFTGLQDQFQALVCGLVGKDLNARFTSPFASFVKLKLGDAIKMNALHNERHLNKALRLLERTDFPR
ncbi:MAG: DinB family protein [Chlorobia bacterium]|nr:DinB family protein [Fimbriimonadaceae bacterium]